MNEIESLLFTGQYFSLNWDLIKISGNDAERFLQGQTTSNIKNIGDNQFQVSALCDLQGKIQAYFYIGKCHSYWILIPSVFSSLLIDRFNRYIIMDEVEIELIDNGTALLGIGAKMALYQSNFQEKIFSVEIFNLPAVISWNETFKQEIISEYSRGRDSDFLAIRLLSGWPEWNKEICEGMLFNETYLAKLAYDPNKGCFLGQEVVSKIESRRGPAYFPVLGKIKMGDFGNNSKIYLNENGSLRKIGELFTKFTFNNESFVYLSLLRDYRVDGSYLRAYLDTENTVELEISYFPFQLGRKGHLALYDRAVELYTHHNQAEKAIEYLQLAIKIRPDFADGYEVLGVILGSLNKFTEAIELMRKLLEVDPQSVMAHTNLSLFLMKVGQIEEAEKEKSNALVKSFQVFGKEAGEKRAKEEAEKKRQEEMNRRESMFRQVLEIDPDDTLANYGLGDVFFEKGSWDDAKRHLEKVLKIDKGYSVAYLTLGKTLEAIGNKDSAISIYKEGIKIAAGKGELMPANEMQRRLSSLENQIRA